ncbi:hypothetical protein HNR60_003177 [Rhodopseudomonas rhenobacensis]|uniref:Uncharacterized protein n=1 Tax=Rhodopseudomonas rhenobacensis TaxID=87461 RepID=A0A7W8E103_9BRAD|nr:DUF5413 family protein [Rhodopseudomonas rhenobacensis]MBB5048411.1 hypothetical protein [Rhodopseudomonas rhenobacensis]
MKRYVIFALIGPSLGGFLLLIATTVMSGYWDKTSLSEVGKLFVILFSTLQYSYLFGLLPSLMMAAIDDILAHVKGLQLPLRMAIGGAIGFVATALMYGGRGADSGVKQFVLYGLVGLVPTLLNSWLSRNVTPKEAVAKA